MIYLNDKGVPKVEAGGWAESEKLKNTHSLEERTVNYFSIKHLLPWTLSVLMRPLAPSRKHRLFLGRNSIGERWHLSRMLRKESVPWLDEGTCAVWEEERVALTCAQVCVPGLAGQGTRCPWAGEKQWNRKGRPVSYRDEDFRGIFSQEQYDPCSEAVDSLWFGEERESQAAGADAVAGEEDHALARPLPRKGGWGRCRKSTQPCQECWNLLQGNGDQRSVGLGAGASKGPLTCLWSWMLFGGRGTLGMREVPGIKPAAHQWQRQILTLLHHQGTLLFCFLLPPLLSVSYIHSFF